MIEWLYLILAGLISGVFGGMGMGGGTLLIPILTIFLGFTQKNAQAINLLVFIPMALVSLIIHIKNKLVDFKVGILIMATGICFSLIGSMLASSISNDLLRKIFGGFLVAVGLNQVIQTIKMAKNKKNKKDDKNSSHVKLRIYIK